GFVYWVGLAVRSLLLLMVWHASSARWPVVLRGLVEAHGAIVAAFLALFIALLVFARWIFVWIAPPAGLPQAELETIHHKGWYLNTWGFFIRGVIYFAVWAA